MQTLPFLQCSASKGKKATAAAGCTQAEEEAGEVWGSVLLCENVEIFLMMWRFTGFHLIEASLI